jgi:hypothetical protein
VKTGVQSVYEILKLPDSGFRRNDEKLHFQSFYEFISFDFPPFLRFPPFIESKIIGDHVGRDETRGPDETAPGMAAGSAKIKVPDGGFELGQFGKGPEIFQLRLDHAAHENPPVFHVIQLPNDILGSQNRDRQDILFVQVRSILPPLPDQVIGIVSFDLVPLFRAPVF